MRTRGQHWRIWATMRATSSTAPALPPAFAGAGGDVGTPLPRQQHVPAAEHVERQIAVPVVVAVEEAAFLAAVQRDVGIVEIEHDLPRRALMRLEEKIDQQRVDPRPVAVDLVILRGMAPRRVLQAIERALARQRLAVLPHHRRQLARQNRKGRILAQLVVIVQVLIAQRQPEDPLPNQRLELVLDKAGIAPVGEARRKPTHQPEAPIDLAQQQRPRVRGDVAAIEPGHHRAAFYGFKFEQRRRTLCRHRGAPGS